MEDTERDIVNAYAYLRDHPNTKRLDGDGWSAYRVGDMIRIDIKGN